jgi:hypothetical protein
MENILGYRHFVDNKTKEIFIESAKEALKNIKISKLGFIGVVGSYDQDYSHDIDLMIFPAENSKLGEAITEMVAFYKEIDKILKKSYPRYYFVPCPKKAMQELVYYLASLEEGSAGLIPVHSLFFTDLKSFKRLNPTNFAKEVSKSMIPLYGDFNIIKRLKPLKQKNLEIYFWILDFEMNARIKSFPRHLIRASAESLFCYLEDKYNIPIKNKKIHDVEQIEKEFMSLLTVIDKKVYG